MLRSASNFYIRRAVLCLHVWPAPQPNVPYFSTNLRRDVISRPLLTSARLPGLLATKRIGSSWQTEGAPDAHDGSSVTTCNMAQLHGEAGKDFVKSLKQDCGFIVYRTRYGFDEHWIPYIESLSRHARLNWGLRVLIVEDKDELNDITRGQLRKQHNDWVLSVIESDPSDVPERIGRIWYGAPGLDYFVHVSDEPFRNPELDGPFQFQRFTLVSALWKKLEELPAQERPLARWMARLTDREESRGYSYYEICDLSPKLYRNLQGHCPNEALKFYYRYGKWSCK